MKKILLKLARAVVRSLETPPEKPIPDPIGRHVNQEGSKTGIIGDYAKVDGGIHFHTASDKKKDVEELLSTYRRMLLKSLQHLPLRGIDIGASDPSSSQACLELDRVYVELDTQTQIEVDPGAPERHSHESFFMPRHTRPLSAMEAAAQNRCLVILGDPGSGKSTFIHHLAFCLASKEHVADTCARLSCSPEDRMDLLPVLVVLRDFATWVKDTVKKADAGDLWGFIVDRLSSQQLSPVADVLRDVLEKGNAIILLDGLDEIPTADRRSFIREAVQAFSGRYDQCRFIVTCRVLSYQNPEWQLDAKNFPAFELAPFDGKKIDAFIQSWYEDLRRLDVIKSAEERDEQVRRLKAALKRPDLARLAPNPLLLTVMALVHTHKGRLPDVRALLYEETVDILLWRWEQVKIAEKKSQPHIRELLIEAGRTDVDLKKLIWRLAYEAHGKSDTEDDDSLADIREWDLMKALAGLHPKGSTDWASKVIDAVKLRAGLLLEREPEIYTFPHRTFQEYLAGAFLSSQSNFSQTASQLIETGNFWREVILMAVGRLVYLAGDSDKPMALVGELCPENFQPGDTAWRKVWMAGEVLVEIGMNRVNDSRLGRDLSIRVRMKLVDLLSSGALTPKERVAAGNALGRLGDPRFNPEMWHLPNDGALGFVPVHAGPFDMGEGDERHLVELSDYAISKYPVTVAQYRAFAENSGLTLDERWKEYNRVDNHPVVIVSWHDATAYCAWLTKKLKDRGMQVALPTEAQWEKAARGADGREYPWGNDDIMPEKANYHGTEIRTTSPVGCFPAGGSPYKILDMSGNIWEWCQDWYGEYSKGPIKDPVGPDSGSDRVLRGGAWSHDAEYCRSAFRFRIGPDDRIFNLGFRLVCLPGQRGEPSR